MSLPYFTCYSCGVSSNQADKDIDDEPTEDLVLVSASTTNKSSHHRSSSTTLRNSNSHGTFSTEGESSGSESSSSHNSSSNRENRRRTTAAAKNNTNNTMRRNSISRRNDHLASPPMRSRSQERHQECNKGSNNNDSSSSSMMMKEQHEQLHSSSSSSGPQRQRVASEDVEKERRIHRRSVSDPFDAQQEQGEENKLLSKITAAASSGAAGSSPSTPAAPAAANRERTFSSSSTLAANKSATSNAYLTLPRYPVAETRDKNCWSEPPVSIFSIRGANYFVDKKKELSRSYLMPSRGCDLFLSETNDVDLNAIGDHILGGRLRSLPTVLVNFRFPWGVLILYYEVPEKLRPYMLQQEIATNGNSSTLTRQELVLAKWLQGDEEYKNDRLKLISYVAEGPWVVRNMVTGRPALIGKKLPVTYSLDKGGGSKSHGSSTSRHQNGGTVVERQPLLQCTLDIGSSSATAKRIVSVCRRYMASLTVDIGFVIQAEDACELPEQMMSATRVHGVDPIKAPQL